VSYFWYSITGGNETWTLADSSQRERVVSEIRPTLVTVLDAYSAPEPGWSREEFIKMKYSGPLYFDWDGGDDDESRLNVIKDFQTTVTRLVEEHKVLPQAMAMYCTGGKGFHLEVPMTCFMTKVPPGGVTQLPHVYKLMAAEFYTDSMDTRIYSARQGRMWRVPNVLRPGKNTYKVQISYEEAMAMTPELYAELVSKPRLLIPLVKTEPSISLQALFLTKRDAVESENKRLLKAKDERQELAKFKGEFPQSVKMLMAGLHLKEGASFNDISMQFCVLATVMGKTLDELLEACEGFIQNHQGDSYRYNSPAKRKAALAEKFIYLSGTPCYTFSFGALRSICEEGYEPDELRPETEYVVSRDVVKVDDITDSNGKVDVVEYVKRSEAALTEDAREGLKAADRGGPSEIIVSPRGVYYTPKGAEYPVKLSDIGFINPWTLKDAKTLSHVGFQAQLISLRNGKTIDYGRKELTGDVFKSRASLDNALSLWGSNFTGTDVQATVVRKALSDMADKNDQTTYVLIREGLDVITDPDKPDDVTRELVWVTNSGVVLASDVPDDPDAPAKISTKYVYRPRIAKEAIFKSDVHQFFTLNKDMPGLHKWLDNLLKFNKDDYVVAASLGWFVSCFHRAIHHHIHSQFPILMLYGEAGSGKTSTPSTLAKMFWGKEPIKKHSATRGSMTVHSRRGVLAGSCSIPALVDEFKRAEMGETEYSKFIGELRTSYNSGTIAMGGITTGAADSDFRTISEFERSTPVCIMSETLIDETAFMERSVIVAMDKTKQDPAAWEVLNNEESRALFISLGALILWRTMKTSIESFSASFYEARAEVLEIAQKKGIKANERPITNTAVVVTGLKFLKDALTAVGITGYSSRLTSLGKEMVSEEILKTVGAPRSEIYKTLDQMVDISRQFGEDEEFSIKEGFDYCYYDTYIDLNIRGLFVKHANFMKYLGTKSYFPTFESFTQAVRKLPACDGGLAMDSPLRKAGVTTVFRFDAEKLYEAGVERFKSVNEK